MRKTWLLGTLLVGVTTGLFGSVAVAVTKYQQGVFEETTSHVQEATGATIALRRVLNHVDEPASGMMYGLGGPEKAASHAADYSRARVEVAAALDRLEAVAPPGGSSLVVQARESWERVDLAVQGAPQLLASGAVADGIATGQDPYGPVWADYGTIGERLADIEGLSMVELNSQVESAARVHAYLPAVLITVLAVALGVLVLVARRVRSRVLLPLEQLRCAAVAMREAEPRGTIDVRHASAELQTLARAIEETAEALRATHGELREQASTDALTGLANRKSFTEQLHARFAGQADQQLGVLFVDLDDFKLVNDELGHAAGDELLQIVAARLRGATRKSDLVARLGGDEFAVLVNCDDGVRTASVVAESLLASLNSEVIASGRKLSVDCSIGVATSGASTSSADELLRNADFAMYMAKGRGKNCVETFAPSMHLAMQNQTEFKQDLSQAVSRGQLLLHHQPVLDLGSQRVLGFEALVRWQHPTRGLVPPLDFITLAEETGDIVKLGEWVLDQACADLRDYRKAGTGDDELWMSVNISSQQLADPQFTDVVLAALTRHQLPPRALILEITEHSIVDSTDSASETLERLRRRGVRIAIDDFGVGFSSLRYLNELPVDLLKIDRSFVAAPGDRATSMLGAIISMAANLGLSVIAEGIEEPAQLERLRHLGAAAGQGYLFARPLPAHEAIAALSRCDNRGIGDAALPAPRQSSSPPALTG